MSLVIVKFQWSMTTYASVVQWTEHKISNLRIEFRLLSGVPHVRLVQWNRMLGYEPRGREFESLSGCQSNFRCGNLIVVKGFFENLEISLKIKSQRELETVEALILFNKVPRSLL